MKQIYVVAPAFYKSGGPELLHQFVFEANKHPKNSTTIAYVKNKKYNLEQSTNPAFEQYLQDGNSCFFDEILDDENSVVILPETMTRLGKKFKYAKVYVWWLSVDNYFYNRTIIDKIFFKKKLPTFLKKFGHLSQSQFATYFLTKNGIESQKLSDYINTSFIDLSDSNNSKLDQVIFNPKKGYRFTKKIMRANPDVKFVPLINMNLTQLSNTMMQSKVYIDFGNHPGKDRLPREAAINNCIIITGRRGSSKFFEDISISENYKFDDKKSNINKISQTIKHSLNNYKDAVKDFDQYKKKILNEKNVFVEEVIAFLEAL